MEGFGVPDSYSTQDYFKIGEFFKVVLKIAQNIQNLT